MLKLNSLVLVSMVLLLSSALWAGERLLGTLAVVERTFVVDLDKCEKVFQHDVNAPWNGACVVHENKKVNFESLLGGQSIVLSPNFPSKAYGSEDFSCVTGADGIPPRQDPLPAGGFQPRVVVSPLVDGYKIQAIQVPFCRGLVAIRQVLASKNLEVKSVVQTVR